MFTAHRHISTQAYTPVGRITVKAEVCNLIRKWAGKSGLQSNDRSAKRQVDHTITGALDTKLVAREIVRLRK